MSRRRTPEPEIIPPGESLLGWNDMLHHRPPPEPPKPLPSAVIAHLAYVLEDAMALCKSGDLSPLIAKQMIRALGPIVRRQQYWRQVHADEPKYTPEDRKTADRIATLFDFRQNG